MRRIVLLSIVLLSMFSCRDAARQEALHTVAVADSLFAAGGLLADTCRLQQAIDVLERHACLDHDALARAYYYLGRNYDLLHMDSREVPCFIRCIKLRTKDRQYEGRSYSNLRAICENHGEYKAAYKLAVRMVACYDTSDSNDKLLTISKLRVCYLQAKAGMLPEAMEAYGKLEESAVDLFAKTYYYKIGAELLFCAEQYNEAVRYMHKSLQYPVSRTELNYSKYLTISQAFSALGQEDSARYYCRLAIQNPWDGIDKIRAFDYWDECFADTDDSALIDYYKAESRAMQNRMAEVTREEAKAAGMICKYIEMSEKNSFYKKIIGGVAAVVLLAVCAIVILYAKRKYKYKTALGELSDNMTSLQNELSSRSADSDIRKQILLKRLEALSQQLPDPNAADWKDDSGFRRKYNALLFDLPDKLEISSGLKMNEIRMCVLVLLQAPQKQMADCLFISLKSVGKTKLRLAQKLNTTSANLRDFLIDFAAR